MKLDFVGAFGLMVATVGLFLIIWNVGGYLLNKLYEKLESGRTK